MTSEVQAWVLFDGACGFCSRWVPFWGRLLAAHGVGIARLQERWVADRLSVPTELLLRDLLVIQSTGTIHRGAGAYRFVFRRIPWAWPFHLVAQIPVGREIFNGAYRAFARNRHRFSTACGLASIKLPSSSRTAS